MLVLSIALLLISIALGILLYRLVKELVISSIAVETLLIYIEKEFNCSPSEEDIIACIPEARVQRFGKSKT